MMGNFRWFLRKMGELPKVERVTEIGAGDGFLLRRIHEWDAGVEVMGYDLAERPVGLPEGIGWKRRDVLRDAPAPGGGVLVANLILHHFKDEELGGLAAWARGFDVVLINEPHRSRVPMVLGKLAWPLIHPITRHDMRVSIEAGFVRGEIAEIFGKGWKVCEEVAVMGGLRVVLCR